MKNKKPINEMLPVAADLVERLKPYCERIEICGSIRRKKEMVGDIEILCQPKKGVAPWSQLSLFGPNIEKPMPEFMEFIRHFKVIKGCLDRGKMVSFEIPGEIQVDLFTGNDLNYGYQKALRTGPFEYNIKFLLYRLNRKGYRSKDGLIYKKGEVIPVPNEEDLYDLIGCNVHRPEDRYLYAIPEIYDI